PSHPDPGRGHSRCGFTARGLPPAAVPAAASTRYRAVTPPRRRSALRRARRDRSGAADGSSCAFCSTAEAQATASRWPGSSGNRSVSGFFARSTGLTVPPIMTPLLPPSHRHIAERSALTAQVRCAAHASTATTHTGLAACSAHRPANGSGNDELTLAYRCIRLYWWLPIVTGVWRRIRSGSAVATGRDLTSVRDSPSRPFSQRRGVPSTTRPRWRGDG